MKEKYSIGLLGIMDQLWFHQIILFSITPSISFLKNLENPLPIQDSLTSVESEIILLQDVCEKEEDNEKERSTRNMSHSLSPKKYSRNRVLEKTLSNYKSLGDLELEELRGFMDLGFIFRKEHISKRMINVIPGLQRLEIEISEDEEKICENSKAIVTEGEEDDKREIARPYLSEAWLIKRPNSPLLNMRIPRISAASDMKKHLRYWAKTVATVVMQESLFCVSSISR
ncbi:hypothetical protein H5410_053596 [Solanum commersonii]|uniref:Uncharacterized protein n=1 Tax=Solanum commersonii TaxID=4109 RepID=A0A9J5X3X5_SOLCO|nr:hypothetical protein H5410_053596 [Solanum commersonii]